jgi:hypothetical protein
MLVIVRFLNLWHNVNFLMRNFDIWWDFSFPYLLQFLYFQVLENACKMGKGVIADNLIIYKNNYFNSCISESQRMKCRIYLKEWARISLINLTGVAKQKKNTNVKRTLTLNCHECKNKSGLVYSSRICISNKNILCWFVLFICGISVYTL